MSVPSEVSIAVYNPTVDMSTAQFLRDNQLDARHFRSHNALEIYLEKRPNQKALKVAVFDSLRETWIETVRLVQNRAPHATVLLLNTLDTLPDEFNQLDAMVAPFNNPELMLEIIMKILNKPR